MSARLACMTAALVSSVAATELRDPTRPPDYASAPPVVITYDTGEFIVNGITLSSYAKSAVVNGIVVVPGQIVDGAVVLDITDKAVVLDVNGQQLVAELPRVDLKQAVEN